MEDNYKIALITGASRGIGNAIAINLISAGYKVIGTSTSKKGKIGLNKAGIIGLELDLNQNESIKSFNEIISREYSDISILINNAGITRDNLVIRMKENEWKEVINIHLNGTFKISKNILKLMLKKRWGRIINITSASAALGNKGQSNYAAAKSGIEAFSRSLAREVGSRNITINSVAPGYIETDMTKNIIKEKKKEIIKQIPLSRFGKPEEIAELVNFLVSNEASYITGQTIHINGGLFI